MCFVFFWEQTATCATYSINWLVFYNRDEKCLLRGTDWVFKLSSLLFFFNMCNVQDGREYNININFTTMV